MKTNKALAKRVKLTKNGKLKRRSVGQCVLKAKHSSSQRLAKKQTKNFSLSNKDKSRFLPKK